VQIFLHGRLVINKREWAFEFHLKSLPLHFYTASSALLPFILARVQSKFYVFDCSALGPWQEAVKSHCCNIMEITHGSKVNKSYRTDWRIQVIVANETGPYSVTEFSNTELIHWSSTKKKKKNTGLKTVTVIMKKFSNIYVSLVARHYFDVL
jgi:hypothetical protein